jgi:hypothetical protein
MKARNERTIRARDLIEDREKKEGGKQWVK